MLALALLLCQGLVLTHANLVGSVASRPGRIAPSSFATAASNRSRTTPLLGATAWI